jgi:hypothetical protein
MPDPTPSKTDVAASRVAVEAVLADLNRDEAKIDLPALQAAQAALKVKAVDDIIQAFTAAKAGLSTNPGRNQCLQNVIDCLVNTRFHLGQIVTEAVQLASPPAPIVTINPPAASPTPAP